MPRQKAEDRSLYLNKQARELLILEMENKSLTRRDLAKRLNCSYEAVHQVLTGFRAMNLTTLERYAQAIGIAVAVVKE